MDKTNRALIGVEDNAEAIRALKTRVNNNADGIDKLDLKMRSTADDIELLSLIADDNTDSITSLNKRVTKNEATLKELTDGKINVIVSEVANAGVSGNPEIGTFGVFAFLGAGLAIFEGDYNSSRDLVFSGKVIGRSSGVFVYAFNKTAVGEFRVNPMSAKLRLIVIGQAIKLS